MTASLCDSVSLLTSHYIHTKSLRDLVSSLHWMALCMLVVMHSVTNNLITNQIGDYLLSNLLYITIAHLHYILSLADIICNVCKMAILASFISLKQNNIIQRVMLFLILTENQYVIIWSLGDLCAADSPFLMFYIFSQTLTQTARLISVFS